MDPTDSLDSFTEKWRARWPEWTAAMAFVPAAQREQVAAWFALLQALTDAAWGGADAVPGLAKLAWWQDELGGWAKGARRHPLGAVLQAQAAPWAQLARSLPALRSSRARPEEAASPGQIEAFADAVAACEAALFDAGGGGDSGAAGSVVLHSLRAEHVLHHPDTVALDHREVASPAPTAVATRPRRIHAAIVQARLHRPGSPPSPWLALRLAWRAARGR
ncbi:MAG: phytoene/squalene synthase family protein [Luteimonas sp.]